MSDIEILRELVNKKIENQGVLREKYKKLDNLYIDLRSSKIYRWFGSSYLILKRIFTFLIGILFLFLAILLFIYPKSILDKETLEGLKDYSRQYYVEMISETFDDALKQLIKDNSDFTIEEIVQQLDQSIDASIEKEIITSIKVISGLLLLVSLIFFYISRLSKKMRSRNSKISNAESLTQEIIRNFKMNLEESEKEIVLLQGFINSKH